MSIQKTLAVAAVSATLLGAGGAAAVSAMIPDPVEASVVASAATAEEYRQTLDAMKPPKRARPVVAVLGDNRGTEAIDFLIPYAVLQHSGVADVVAVGMTDSRLKLRPALTVSPQATIAQFNRQFPQGADYVVVPAMSDHDDPLILDWIRSQAERGATLVAICAGAEILANAGLLRDRSATTHWASVEKILEREPKVKWVPHRRYVADRGIVTTTGVSAAIPVSLALVEAIAGTGRASRVAADLGVRDWDQTHDSSAYDLNNERGTLLSNILAKWRHEEVGIPVADGVDDIALAVTADSWSRTYRSTAMTFATAQKVRTRYGLNLVVDRSSRTGLERIVGPVRQKEPARALDRTLDQIATAYGKRTARLVAIQLEYDGDFR